MYFKQFVRNDIGCAGYLVASAGGAAAVVDPRLDMAEEILAEAAREGLTIRYVIETHTHADHVSGHHEIARRTGATVAIHADAGVAYPHLALQHGDEIVLDEVRLRVIHTPGHRPEHIAIAVIDGARGDDPWLVLTGDSLFVGDVARPDLAIPGVEGARTLYRSLHERLLTLPEGTLVYPAHVAGSLCGRVTSRMTGSTIGYERRFNPGLQLDEEAFVRFTTEGLPERPPNLLRIVALNKAASPPARPSPLPLSPAEVAERAAAGAVVLDVRPPAAFSAGHLPGAIGVDLHGGQFQNRVGLIVSAETELLIVANDDAEARRAAEALAVIGFDRVSGYLEGGVAAWRAAGFDLAPLEELSARELAERRRREPSLVIVDVREPAEWEEGHIEGALSIPLSQVPAELARLPADRPLAVVCAGGTRSVIAASLLRARGRTNALNVRDGMDGWRAAGLPVVRGAPAGVR
ncbi:MAG: rhodanese-like domain-containing protein [Dehalococcoidia bacterium]|nr:rhodanese-like domain-containing protein [Dehalococcoidia bacterium]